MNAYESESAAPSWGRAEETVLLMAREQEWAEAYALEHPECPLGRLYLDFIRQELIQALGEL